ncbi:anti-sigma factor [Paenarthrobacter sp. PH39-S1]|uniref:anti-sigma factor n=1 Tax=Paenarthrobacter sp. PH39-S1 TaxID=3046204 RepID=UPI0024BA7A83|nr:anti-sigma factor [Paenarthrobacter sp. PH39-S1]MDJ0356483.1 anti-sigma factor [Paenarthrobacter sp. PH39-S1]
MNGQAINSNQFAEDIATDLAQGRVMELAEIYAVHAVTDAERAEIDGYISSAPPEIRHGFEDRVRQASEALAAAYATDEAEPPVGLLDSILAQLPPAAAAAGASEAPAPGADASDTGADASYTAGTSDELSARREQKAARRGLSSGRRWLIGVAAAAAIVIGGVGVGTNIFNSQDPTRQILNAADLQTKKIEFPAGGTATLAISGSKDAAVVTMENVPDPPAGKVYQMWLIPKNGTAPVSQGTVDAEALSKATTIKGVDSSSAFAITVEPAGGSVGPTMPTVASLPLNS